MAAAAAARSLCDDAQRRRSPTLMTLHTMQPEATTFFLSLPLPLSLSLSLSFFHFFSFLFFSFLFRFRLRAFSLRITERADLLPLSSPFLSFSFPTPATPPSPLLLLILILHSLVSFPFILLVSFSSLSSSCPSRSERSPISNRFRAAEVAQK